VADNPTLPHWSKFLPATKALCVRLSQYSASADRGGRPTWRSSPGTASAWTNIDCLCGRGPPSTGVGGGKVRGLAKRPSVGRAHAVADGLGDGQAPFDVDMRTCGGGDYSQAQSSRRRPSGWRHRCYHRARASGQPGSPRPLNAGWAIGSPRTYRSPEYAAARGSRPFGAAETGFKGLPRAALYPARRFVSLARATGRNMVGCGLITPQP